MGRSRNLADGTLSELNVDSNTLAVDATNNRVGIGTASPAVTFDVSGYARTSTGILFGADTAAANALDDYEEGTWTPNVYNNGKSSSWTTKIGTYQKIGQFVFAEFACDSGASAPSAGGALILSGLPYNIAGMPTAARIIGTAYCNATTNSPAPIFFYGGASSTAQIWYAAMNGQDQARLTSGIFGTVMYPVA